MQGASYIRIYATRLILLRSPLKRHTTMILRSVLLATFFQNPIHIFLSIFRILVHQFKLSFLS